MDNDKQLNEHPLKEHFFLKLIYLFLGVCVFVPILISIGISGWGAVLVNFLLSLLLLITTIPLLLKCINPGLSFEYHFVTIVESLKTEGKTNSKYLMEYLGTVSTISLLYTALGYARFDLDFIRDEYWAFILPLPILILLVMSAVSLASVLYNLGLLNIVKNESKSKIKDGFLLFFIGTPLLIIQIYFLQVGVRAIDSFNPISKMNYTDQRIKLYHNDAK